MDLAQNQGFIVIPVIVQGFPPAPGSPESGDKSRGETFLEMNDVHIPGQTDDIQNIAVGLVIPGAQRDILHWPGRDFPQAGKIRFRSTLMLDESDCDRVAFPCEFLGEFDDSNGPGMITDIMGVKHQNPHGKDVVTSV